MKIPHNLIGSNLVQASLYKEVMNQNMYRLFKKNEYNEKYVDSE